MGNKNLFIIFGLAILNFSCSKDMGNLGGYVYQNQFSSETSADSLPPILLPAAPPPNDFQIDLLKVISDGGYAYILYSNDLPTPFDCSENDWISNLIILEDGVPLSLAHSSHADIRNLGLGRYSHWGVLPNQGNALRFSASDNTDPRTNGRSYTFRNLSN